MAQMAHLFANARKFMLVETHFPFEHWRRIRTNIAIERLNRGKRRGNRVVGAFPDDKSALMLATARLKYAAESLKPKVLSS